MTYAQLVAWEQERERRKQGLVSDDWVEVELPQRPPCCECGEELDDDGNCLGNCGDDSDG